MFTGRFSVATAVLAVASLFSSASFAERASGKNYFAAAGLPNCPEPCHVAGADPANWTVYSNVDRLLACRAKPKMLDFSLHTPLDGEGAKAVRACSYLSDRETEAEVERLSRGVDNSTSLHRRASVDVCPSAVETSKELSVMSSRLDSVRIITGQALTGIQELQARLLSAPVICTNESVFSFVHYGETIVGLWIGGRLDNRRMSGLLLQELARHIHENGMPGIVAIQMCAENRNSGFTFGIMADATPGSALSNVQKAVLTWSQAECVGDLEQSKSLGNQSVWYIEPPAAAVADQGLAASNTTSVSRRHVGQRADCRTATVKAGDGCYNVAQSCGISQSDLLKYNGGGNFCSTLIPDQKVCCSSGTLPSSGPPPNADGTCSIKRVEGGDSCASLAVKCGIPGATFTKYNSDSNLCSTLRVGQAVCCSSGKLPDLKPKQKADGSCFDYDVQGGDFCDRIAAYHSLTVDELKDLNKNTWGFSGCENLWSGVKLCLSKGSPPMPAPISNAVCGPQKPDTKAPSDRSPENLAKLNPCPLNVCCNNWGQCGTTIEFCEKPEGNAKPGTKPGCVSNCGMDIVNNGQAPMEFRRVGYFEAWNANRPCLHMDIEQFNRNDFTHVHYAFVDLTTDFKVDTSRHQDQFDKFVKLKGVKRVAAFGGWAASTEPGTFWIFREGVKAENRQTLANNLAEFIWKYDLDGLDIDWEYPGAPDIPGIPPADPIDGQNYLNLLSILRTRLATKSLSIALPASYWYLKAFPVHQIYNVVDYMVFMTYDLHGQWDYDNKWSSPGCPSGNCLRSHVNMTETMNALAMITKAGVPSHKILVGVTSYGRSFQMTTPGCTGPMCTFTGKESGATPGRCTGEPSYLANAEIDELLSDGRGRLLRDNSESDIVVYDNNQWVSYMTDKEKASRTEKWKGLNFGGISDWAVDLAKFGPPPGVALPVTDGGDWRLQKCSNPAVEDTGYTGKQRWEIMGADKAWAEMVKEWENYRDVEQGAKSFVRFMADYYHFPAENTCGSLTDPYVCGPFFCSDFEGKDGTGPAAALVMNALGQVGRFMVSTYTGIESAKNNVPQEKFKSTFAKAETDDNLAMFILINALALGFTSGLAPMFNNMMKSVPSSVKDNAKDISYAAISFGASTAKDVIGSIDKSDGNHIEGLIKKYYEITSKSVDGTLEQMFSGEPDSIKFLSNLISEGKMTPSCPPGSSKNSCNAPPGTVKQEDMRKAWETALYGYLIPQAWRLNDVNPVVVWTNEECDAVGVGTGLFGYVHANDAEWARGCWENSLAYLLYPSGKAQYQGQWNSWYPSKMPPPPGLESIKNGEWTGVSIDDMIFSAADWSLRHGNRKDKEEWEKDPSFSTQENFNQMWGVVSKDKSVVRTTGLVDIPVCLNDDLWDNWFNKPNDRWYSWPCSK